MGSMWSDDDFGPPEMWVTYADVLPLVADHFGNDTPLNPLAARLAELREHGAVAGMALVVCGLDDLMSEIARTNGPVTRGPGSRCWADSPVGTTKRVGRSKPCSPRGRLGNPVVL